MTDADDRAALRRMAEAQTIHPTILALITKNLQHFKQHLSTVESQERYLIQKHLEKHECPWCDSFVSYFEAVPESHAAEYKIGYGPNEHVCPECKKRIVQMIPFIGDWFWGKHEDDKNPNRRHR